MRRKISVGAVSVSVFFLAALGMAALVYTLQMPERGVVQATGHLHSSDNKMDDWPMRAPRITPLNSVISQ